MKKRGMKIGSFVLCLVMLLSMAVVGASAAGTTLYSTARDYNAAMIEKAKTKPTEDVPGMFGVGGKAKDVYTPASWEAFEKAQVDFAQEMIKNKDSQPDDYLSDTVQAKYFDLKKAEDGLVRTTTLTQLSNLLGKVEDVKGLNPANCADPQGVLTNLTLAAGILGLQYSDIVNSGAVATVDIYNKIVGLSQDDATLLINYLNAAIAACKGSGTTTTTVVDDTTTTTAAPGTTTTTTAPVGAVDRSMLQALYTLNANRIENLYTEASWAKFEKAMIKAKAVLDDPDATQAQVRSAFINLKIAISCLEKAPPCVSTTAAPVCTTAAPAVVETTCYPVATTCAPVATTCVPVETTCVPVATTCAPVATTCVPVVTTTAAPAVVETTCYPVVPTTCVPVVTTTAAPAVVETTCVTVIVTPTVIVTVPVVATTAAPADIDVPDTGVESDMALLLLVASAAIVGVIILKKKVTA